MANSRIVVRKLEMRLKDASEEEISEMARNEMRAVIAQIKAQLDLQEQQSRLAEAQRRVKEKVSANERGIASLSEHEQAQDAELKAHRQAGERLEQEVRKQALKDKEHDAALQKQFSKDREHDEELRRQAQKDLEHDAELKRQSEKDAEHDAELKRQSQKDREHDAALAEIRKALEAHKFVLDNANRMSRMSKCAIILSAVSIIVSISTAAALIVRCVK